MAPCDARILVRVEPHPDNRLLRLEWAEGASERQLEAEKAPKTWRFELSRLSDAQDISVAVFDQRGRLRGQTSRSIHVVPRGPE